MELVEQICDNTPVVAARSQYIANIESLRILASFGVVWFHTDDIAGRFIGYTGLPIFLLIFCSLSVRSSRFETFVSYAGRKARRLLKPWLFWSIIYMVHKLIKQFIQGTEFSENFTSSMFFTGPSIHLWYLPFAFAMALAVNLLKRYIVDIPVFILILIMEAGGIVLLSISSISLSSWAFVRPLPEWLFGIPAIPLGFAVGKINSCTSGRRQSFLYMAIVIFTCAASVMLYYLGYRIAIIQYSLGLFLVCAAFVWKGRWNPFLERFASLTFGIYLIHPLVYSVLKYVTGYALSPWSSLILVFLISSLATMMLQKTPLKQFI